jgi:hypothetical protein
MTLNTTSGDPAADSYASLAEADAYFEARAITAWGDDDDAKEAALRRAASYLDNQYRTRWIGLRTNETQALSWPRGDGVRNLWTSTCFVPLLDADGIAIALDAIPAQVKRAQIEAALLILTGSNMESVLSRGNDIKSISKGVGPLSKSITYADSAPAVDRYLAIEGLLAGLVKSTPGANAGNVSLVRA